MNWRKSERREPGKEVAPTEKQKRIKREPRLLSNFLSRQRSILIHSKNINRHGKVISLYAPLLTTPNTDKRRQNSTRKPTQKGKADISVQKPTWNITNNKGEMEKTYWSALFFISSNSMSGFEKLMKTPAGETAVRQLVSCSTRFNLLCTQLSHSTHLPSFTMQPGGQSVHLSPLAPQSQLPVTTSQKAPLGQLHPKRRKRRRNGQTISFLAKTLIYFSTLFLEIFFKSLFFFARNIFTDLKESRESKIDKQTKCESLSKNDII